MKQATIQLDTLTCPSCVLKIESAVKNLAGVDKDSLKVLVPQQNLWVTLGAGRSPSA